MLWSWSKEYIENSDWWLILHRLGQEVIKFQGIGAKTFISLNMTSEEEAMPSSKLLNFQNWYASIPEWDLRSRLRSVWIIISKLKQKNKDLIKRSYPPKHDFFFMDWGVEKARLNPIPKGSVRRRCPQRRLRCRVNWNHPIRVAPGGVLGFWGYPLIFDPSKWWLLIISDLNWKSKL